MRGRLTADQLAEIEAEVESGGTPLFLAWHYMALGDFDRMFDEGFSTPEFHGTGKAAQSLAGVANEGLPYGLRSNSG